jgi:hypothetical protein
MHAYVAKTDAEHPTWSVFTAGQVGDILDFDEAFDAVGTGQRCSSLLSSSCSNASSLLSPSLILIFV